MQEVISLHPNRVTEDRLRKRKTVYEATHRFKVEWMAQKFCDWQDHKGETYWGVKARRS